MRPRSNQSLPAPKKKSNKKKKSAKTKTNGDIAKVQELKSNGEPEVEEGDAEMEEPESPGLV